MKIERRKELIFVVLFTLVALHPIIELDYLAYDFLSDIGLPRLTTIVNFIIYPLLVIAVFFYFEKNKKNTLILASVYAVIFSVYFVLHCMNCGAIIENGHLYLPDNFSFSAKSEVFYTATLLLPLVYVYVFTKNELKDELLKKVSCLMSTLMSLPIIITDLMCISYSTYGKHTLGNVFTWFSLPYDDKLAEPRFFTGKFFFEEGNVTGIIMLLVLPILYYCLFVEENKKKRIGLTFIIIAHSLAMIILSTRVAAFGVVGVPLVMLIYYFVLLLLKKEKLKKWFIGILCLMTVITAVFIPYCPAVQNQLLDSRSYDAQKTDDDYLNAERENAKKETDLIPFSQEWLDYYIYMFRQYKFLIHVTPPVYYLTYYSYRFDPKFWVDLIFDYPLEERIDGRQIEQIFTSYKYDQLETNEKALGMGYSTFMWGSILIERDFVQQYYSYGPIGWLLLIAPWFALLLYCAFNLIRKYSKWTFKNITFMMICCLGFGCAYMSGHTLDQLSCSMVLALAFAVLIKELNKKDSSLDNAVSENAR